MLSEEDTFERLKRVPFDTLARQIGAYVNSLPSGYFESQEEYDQFLHIRGWCHETYCAVYWEKYPDGYFKYSVSQE